MGIKVLEKGSVWAGYLPGQAADARVGAALPRSTHPPPGHTRLLPPGIVLGPGVRADHRQPGAV